MTTSDNDSSRAGSWDKTRERLDRFAGGVERGIFADVRAALDRVASLEAELAAEEEEHESARELLAEHNRELGRCHTRIDEAIARAERAEARRMAAEGAKREWDRMKAEVTRFREALEAIARPHPVDIADYDNADVWHGVASRRGKRARAALQGAREEPDDGES